MGSVALTDHKQAREIARDWRRIARAGGDPQAERAYRRTDLSDTRRDMMDAWAGVVMARDATVIRLGA